MWLVVLEWEAVGGFWSFSVKIEELPGYSRTSISHKLTVVNMCPLCDADIPRNDSESYRGLLPKPVDSEWRHLL
jgi:hypothetical protein